MTTKATAEDGRETGSPGPQESPGNARDQDVLIRASHLDKMRDPLHADWNRDLMGSGSPLPAGDLAEWIDFSQMNAIFAHYMGQRAFFLENPPLTCGFSRNSVPP